MSHEYQKNNAIDDDFDLETYTIEELLSVSKDDKSDNILGNRLLTKEGSWLIIAESGVGKSVLAMQMAITFALGRSLWGLEPAKPLKIALLQAENNKQDLIEPLHSISDCMGLSDDDRNMVNDNFKVYHNSTECGSKFANLLNEIGEEFSPDIVIIDPLLSYIGGDISKQEVCSRFLRNTIHPIIKRYQMGIIFLHHTPKPKQEKDINSNLVYAGAGSAELVNYCRATSCLFKNSADTSVYDFSFGKRGRRFDDTGIAPIKYLRQGEKKQIYWYEVSKPKEVPKEKTKKKRKYDDLGIENLAPMSKIDMSKIVYSKIKDAGLAVEDEKKDIENFWNNNIGGKWLRYYKETDKWEGVYYLPT